MKKIKEGGDETAGECWMRASGVLSSLYLPSLSLFPSHHISLSISPSPSLDPDAGRTEHLGEIQLFYRWDQRETACACVFLCLCPCVLKMLCIYDVVLAGLQLFKGLVRAYTRFGVKVSIKSRPALYV